MSEVQKYGLGIAARCRLEQTKCSHGHAVGGPSAAAQGASDQSLGPT